MSHTTEEGGKESSRSRKGLRLCNQDQDQNQDDKPGPTPANMSESLRRRNSSKKLLQNLIRVTVQRSQEDAEEIERERRRRAREKQKEEGIVSFPEPLQQDNSTHSSEFAGVEPSASGQFAPTVHETVPSRRCFVPTLTADPVKSDKEPKPSSFVLEEDEGFSDWSHRLENRSEQEVQENFRVKEQKPSADLVAVEYKHKPCEEVGRGYHGGTNSEEASTQHSEDAGQHHAAGYAADRMSYLAAGTMKTRSLSGKAHRLEVENEQKMQKEDNEKKLKPKLQKEQQCSTDKEIQEEEKWSSTGDDQGDLHIRKEGADRKSEEKQEEYQEIQSKRSEESQRGWGEEASSGRTGSHYNSEGEESLNSYGPMSPTFKKLLIQFYPDEVNSRISPDGKCTITERSENLRRSTSNIRKTLPALSYSKIDKRLEEYTHALEVSSKEVRPSCQMLTDVTSPCEPVSSKKNLFEAGEAWNQNVTSVTPSKDADGLKVGVAGLINQWVKGGEEGGRSSSTSKPAEIRPGGVLKKKNLWETLGDTLTSTRDGKESFTKRYKYVVTGHGKYTKVSDDGCSEDVNSQAAEQFFEDL